MSAGERGDARCTKKPLEKLLPKPKETRDFGCPISRIENRLIIRTDFVVVCPCGLGGSYSHAQSGSLFASLHP
jgi:hypothetical protein